MANKLRWSNTLQKLEAILDEYLVRKAPGLSIKAKDFIVSILPWLSLIFGLLGFIGSLRSLAFFPLSAPYIISTGLRIYFPSFFYSLLSLIGSGLELLAIPHLFKKAKRGWQLLFYSSLIGAFSSLISLSGLGLLITSLILYFLFQVKEFYF